MLSTVMGWPLEATIIATGAVVLLYTVSGGNDAVNVTQTYQLAVIFAAMAAAFALLVARMPEGLSLGESLALAGAFGKLEAVDYTFDLRERYTVWSGIVGGVFLSLAYFGTDQSQVQRYLSGRSVRESRLGLMFNAVFKIPMQAVILLLGVLLFVHYRFETPPVYFNRTAWASARAAGAPLEDFERRFVQLHAEQRERLRSWLAAERAGDAEAAAAAMEQARALHEESRRVRRAAAEAVRSVYPRAKVEDYDYIFITFILERLPHGLIGLLMAAFFAAALSSLSAELSALGETAGVDYYRALLRPGRSEAHYVAATRWLTAGWGIVAVAFALFIEQRENLIEAINIVGSLFYGPLLGLFLTAFFLRRVGGRAAFWGALAGQAAVVACSLTLSIGFLWYNLIGCAACLVASAALQGVFGARRPPAPAS